MCVGGDTLEAWHAVPAALRVSEYETASDEDGITIRGTVEFEGNLKFNLAACRSTLT